MPGRAALGTETLMSSHFRIGDKSVERDQFAAPIECPKCGQRGVVTWEKTAHGSVKGPEPTLVNLSPEFYERVSKKVPYPIELVCNRCGATQDE
jgi:DNA-directed RNA polymerase subunit RPC12/RpoP